MAKKIQGEAICSNCSNNILADDDMVKAWSMEDLKKHLLYRENNRNQIEAFVATREVDYDGCIKIDDVNRQFYFEEFGEENPPIFKFEEILGFNMELGYNSVESWSRGMQRTPYRPVGMELASGLSMLAEAFSDSDKKKENKYDNLKVILQVRTPYLKEYTICEISISGNGNAEFQHDFSMALSKADSICNLIVSMASGSMSSASPVAAPSDAHATASADQVTDGIKKFKELL
ncbi:MAG: hypothetical protein RRY40_04260, partial [Oscillospiraceae bacterium]